MKIALVQMPSAKGETAQNLERTLSFIDSACQNGAEAVVFPEMSLTGYFTEEKCAGACLMLDSIEVKKVIEASECITIIFGIGESDNEKKYISQIVAQNGKLLGVYRKHNIKNDEALLFSPGLEEPVFTIGEKKFGIVICADIDCPELFAGYAKKGCDIIFECASPDLYGKRDPRNWEKGYLWWKNNCIEKIGKYAKDNRIKIAVATGSGRNEEDDFPGGGFLFSPEGETIKETTDYKQEILFVEI